MKKTMTNITKILSALLTFIFVCCFFTGCNADANTNTPTTPAPGEAVETAAPTEQLTWNFPQLAEKDEEILDQYIADVQKRISSDDGFITTEEAIYFMEYEDWNIHTGYVQEYDSMWGSTEDYYYPVLYMDNGNPILVYTDEYGYVESKRIDEVGYSNYYGYLHRPDLKEDYEVMSSDIYNTILYQNSQVQVWEFREIVATYEIPEGATYCGRSAFEGYLFHKSDKVYTLTSTYFIQDEDSKDFHLVKIADGVKYVILADYRLSSDPWSQPLFLMEDGNLKAYVHWRGNKDDLADPSHLVDPFYEGGYRR